MGQYLKYYHYPRKRKVVKKVKDNSPRPRKVDEHTEARNYVKQAAAEAQYYLELAEQHVNESIETAKKAQTVFYLSKAETLLTKSVFLCVTARQKWREILNTVTVKICKSLPHDYKKYLKEVKTIYGKQLEALETIEKSYVSQGYSLAEARIKLEEVRMELGKQFRRIQEDGFNMLYLSDS